MVSANGLYARSDNENVMGGSRQSEPSTDDQIIDEAILIEERRKRREAIKAKHKGQMTPMLVQALALSNSIMRKFSDSDNTGGLVKNLG